MGYRSDGAFALKKKYVTRFWRKCEVMALDAEVSEDEEGNLLMTYVAWKMYGSYQEVAAFLRFLDELDDIESDGDEDEAYHYVRLGENDDDIEIRGGWWENPFGVELVRSIGFEHGPKTSTKTDSVREMGESIDG